MIYICADGMQMKSTKVQTLGAVMSQRHTFRRANSMHGSVNSACMPS